MSISMRWKGSVHRIGLHIVHKWEWYDLLSPIVQYVRVCCQMESHIVQLYVMTPHMDMLIHCSTPWTINPVYFQFQFHMRRSRMMFSQSSVCASRFSQHIINDFWLNYYSTFLFSSDLNLTSTFIFALIISYWLNVRPWLQRHFTFDMLLHI